jgi:hypothetical protein
MVDRHMGRSNILHSARENIEGQGVGLQKSPQVYLAPTVFHVFSSKDMKNNCSPFISCFLYKFLLCTHPQSLRVSENRALRKRFEPKMDEGTRSVEKTTS